MAIDASTLVQYDGKQVILHHIQPDGTVEEKEGKVEGASEFGMAFKEKGKRDAELIEPDQIEEIDFAPVKAKSLSQKKLKPIPETSARQHLLDRHGYTRSAVKEMSDEDAAKTHDGIDHSDLGHRHMTPEEVAKAADKNSSDNSED